MMADLGVPDGFAGAVAFRAHPHVNLHLGGGHNTIAPGFRAGVSAYAIQRVVSPYLALEAGHYLNGETASWARSMASSAGLDEAQLDRVGYSFGNAHIGLRIGDAGTSFYLQAGISAIRASVTLRQMIEPDSTSVPPIEVSGDRDVNFVTPSGRLGVQVHF